MPGAPKFLMCDSFIPLPSGGTRLEIRIAPSDAKDKAALAQMFPMMEPMLKATGDALRSAVEEEVARRAALPAEEEPPLPVSAGRFANAPATAGT